MKCKYTQFDLTLIRELYDINWIKLLRAWKTGNEKRHSKLVETEKRLDHEITVMMNELSRFKK